MTPLPHFDVLTPLGRARCIGLIWDTDTPEWVCFIHATGEPWFFTNQLVRLYPSASYGGGATPFQPGHLNKKMRDAVQRYRDAGYIKSSEIGSFGASGRDQRPNSEAAGSESWMAR